jgi:hypothetical protein
MTLVFIYYTLNGIAHHLTIYGTLKLFTTIR